MKNVILNSILILALFAMTACDEIAYKSKDLAEQHLTGQVKQVKETDYKGVGKDRVLLSSSLKKFNENGNLTSDDRFKGNVLDYNITFKYDKNGMISTKRIYQNDSIMMQMTWTYKDGKLVKYEDAKKNGFMETTTYLYDANGNCIRDLINTTWVMDRSLVRNRFVDYKFDASNRCVEKKEYSQYHRDTVFYQYEYDKSGNCICEKRFDLNGTKQMKNMKYFGNDIMKEETRINGYEDDIQEVRLFNERGDLKKSSITEIKSSKARRLLSISLIIKAIG